MIKNAPAWNISAMLIVLLAFFLRVRNLDAQSAWIDEAYSIALAQHSLGDIVRGSAADQHPPVYYLLLHLWMLSGVSVFAARFLSVMIGTVGVAQIIGVGKYLGLRAAGLATALLLALSPMHVWYSQEVRMYILLAAATTAVSLELWLCLQGKGRWLLYGLFALLAIYTQYFAIFVFIAHAIVVALWWLLKRETKTMLRWAMTLFLVILAFAPWLPILVNQARLHSMPWIGTPDGTAIRDTLLMLFVGNLVNAVPQWGRWVAVAILLLLSVWAGAWSLRRGAADALRFGFLAAWAGLCFVIIVAISLIYPLFQPKQFVFLIPALLLWVTAMARTLPRGLSGTIVLVLFATGISQLNTDVTKDDWRAAAAYIRGEFAVGDLVYANPAASALALKLYWNSSFPFDGYPPNYDIVRGGWEGQRVTSEIADQVLQFTTAQYARVWLIEFYPEFWDPERQLENWLVARARLDDDHRLGSIRIRLFHFR